MGTSFVFLEDDGGRPRAGVSCDVFLRVIFRGGMLACDNSRKGEVGCDLRMDYVTVSSHLMRWKVRGDTSAKAVGKGREETGRLCNDRWGTPLKCEVRTQVAGHVKREREKYWR